MGEYKADLSECEAVMGGDQKSVTSALCQLPRKHGDTESSLLKLQG